MDFVARSDQDHDPYGSQSIQQQHVYSDSEQYQAQSAHYPPSHYSSLGAHVSQSAQSKQALPEVGQTRCYWTLLDSSLKFIVLDPVLTYHLRDQCTKFLESSLLDFVHPEERDTARQDLGSVLEERTLHGSVTRVRYYRLSRIRRLLGFKSGSPPFPPSFPADSIAIDNDYMAVYLVINCVAEGVVLCFLHAVVDLPPEYQSQSNGRIGWTNHCSTFGFEEEQARALYHKLYETVPPSQLPYRFSPDSSLRIFQILRDQPNRPLVLSWPPEDTIMQSHYVTPSAQELARLALHVRIDYSLASGSNGEGEVMTNCTQRYKTVQSVDVQTSSGVKCVQIESIFISHGTIIFACHKVDGKSSKDIISDRDLGIPGQQNAFPYEQATHGDNHTFYNTAQVPYGSTYYPNMNHSQPLSSQDYVEQWVEGQNQEDFYAQQARGQQQHWGQLPAPRDPPSSSMNQILQTRSSSASTAVQSPYYQDQWSSHERYADSSTPLSSGVSYVRSQTPSHASSNETFVTNVSNLAPPSSFAVDYPSVAKTSESAKAESPATSNDVLSQGRQSPGAAVWPLPHGNGKGLGTPPVGVSQCSSCQTTHSPEWRKGPSGKKDLCNACGLRYARSRAKKEGVVTRRRKDKDKGPSSMTRIVKHSSSVSSLGSRAAAQSYVRSQRLAEPEDVDNSSGAGLGGPGGTSLDTSSNFPRTPPLLRSDVYRMQHSAPPPDSLGSSPSPPPPPPLYSYYTTERTACAPQANSRQVYTGGEPYYDAIEPTQGSGSFFQSANAAERVSSPSGAVYTQGSQQYPLRYAGGSSTVSATSATADEHTHGRVRGHGHASAPHTPSFIDNRKLGPLLGTEEASSASTGAGATKQRGSTNIRAPYPAEPSYPRLHHADDRFAASAGHAHAHQEKMGIEVPVRNNDYVW